MDHFEAMESLVVINPITGDAHVTNTRRNTIGGVVFKADAIAPEWLNMVRAAPFMYRALASQFNQLEKIARALEASKSNPALISALFKMQDSLLLSMRVALEGLEVVSDEIDREPKATR